MLAVLAAILLSFDNCNFTEDPKERENRVRKEFISMQERMFSEIAMIKYFKDEKPNPPIRFAYLFQYLGAGSGSIGGPALATVDCNSVKDLLTIKGMDEDYEIYKKLKQKYENK